MDKLQVIEGWTLDVAGEPMVRDLELGERLGYERPRDIRKLIERMVADGKLNDIHRCATVARGAAPQPVTEFWLTEAQALKVAAKSETAPADALLDEMIRVFMLARRGQLPAPPARDVLATELRVALARDDQGEALRLHRALGALLGPAPAMPSAPLLPPSNSVASFLAGLPKAKPKIEVLLAGLHELSWGQSIRASDILRRIQGEHRRVLIELCPGLVPWLPPKPLQLSLYLGRLAGQDFGAYRIIRIEVAPGVVWQVIKT